MTPTKTEIREYLRRVRQTSSTLTYWLNNEKRLRVTYGEVEHLVEDRYLAESQNLVESR